MSEARERLLSTSITTSATFDPAGEPIGSVSFSVRQIEDDGFYDLEVVRRFFGGTKPLNSATIYRGIAEGRYPRPVRVSPNANRWLGCSDNFTI
jgi:hypothetical protein